MYFQLNILELEAYFDRDRPYYLNYSRIVNWVNVYSIKLITSYFQYIGSGYQNYKRIFDSQYRAEHQSKVATTSQY